KAEMLVRALDEGFSVRPDRKHRRGDRQGVEIALAHGRDEPADRVPGGQRTTRGRLPGRRFVSPAPRCSLHGPGDKRTGLTSRYCRLWKGARLGREKNNLRTVSRTDRPSGSSRSGW